LAWRQEVWRFAYVINAGSGSVTEIDASSNRVVANEH
jgi:hypothetical protein